jgi:hypothetical protein
MLQSICNFITHITPFIGRSLQDKTLGEENPYQTLGHKDKAKKNNLKSNYSRNLLNKNQSFFNLWIRSEFKVAVFISTFI